MFVTSNSSHSKPKKFSTLYRVSSCSSHIPESPKQGSNVVLRNFNEEIKYEQKSNYARAHMNFSNKNTSMIIRRLYHKKDDESLKQETKIPNSLLSISNSRHSRRLKHWVK